MSKEMENNFIAKQITAILMRVMVFEYLLKQAIQISICELKNEFQHSNKTTLYRTF